LQIDRRQLADLADEVDQLHHESMRTIHEELGELHFGEIVPGHRENRRRFLAKAAAGGALLTTGSLVAPIGRLLPAAGAQAASKDVELASFMASLELAAVEAYKAAAGTGKLNNLVTEIGTMFAGHHQAHADALNQIVGEDAAITKPNAAVLQQFGPQISSAANQDAVLEIAFSLEEAAASTYLSVLSDIADSRDAGVLATILPVEGQHATVLGTILGKDPSEFLIEFVTTDAALDPADYPLPAGDSTE
jgi:hypothetical protein